MSFQGRPLLYKVFAGTIALVVTAALAGRLRLCAFESRQTDGSLRELFQSLVQNYGKSGTPTSDEIGRIGEVIDTGSAEEILDASPAIVAAARHKDPTVRLIGVLALRGVSGRPDKLPLLTQYLQPLSALISPDQDPRTLSLAVATLENVWPQPPPDVLRRLLNYLKRPGGDWRTQADVLRYLVSGAEKNPEVATAVSQYWSRPLNKAARIAAIEAMAKGQPRDPKLIDLVASSLGDPDFNIRLSAFQGLRNLGPAALQQARVPMQKATHEYVSFVRQANADPNEQVSVVQQLLQWAPNDPDVVNAVVALYARPLDAGLRTSVQNAMRISHLENAHLLELVVGSLQDANPEVRTNAANVLADIGPQAVARGRKALEGLAGDPTQPSEVKQAAHRALGLLSR